MPEVLTTILAPFLSLIMFSDPKTVFFVKYTAEQKGGWFEQLNIDVTENTI
jgi:hypothetical protein